MNPPLSLYVHIPWCERKCPYCDFNSHVAKETVDEAQYIDALIFDLEFDLEYFKDELKGRTIDSVFIGGGTPSLFSADSINALIKAVRSRAELASDAEITLEANPGSAESNRFLGFAHAGVTRLSIGVQSFNDRHLLQLGRVHSSGQAVAAAKMAKSAELDFNLDLMYGLPQQTMAEAMSDLEQAVALEPKHISCYQLTIEPNTLFHKNPPPRPDDDALWSMHLALNSRLREYGFIQYEVSAYAKAGKQCRHNLNYWQFGDYLGIGAGAHGKISHAASGVQRYWKIKHPATYLQRSLVRTDLAGSRDRISEENLAFEFMLNALRLSDGFPDSLFEDTTSIPLEKIAPLLDRHTDLGLIERHKGWIRPTERGRAMLDSMLQDYLP
jgi:oxygen-independent coproporphyrinogen-3 oxidase